jgi:hypothetical protein
MVNQGSGSVSVPVDRARKQQILWPPPAYSQQVRLFVDGPDGYFTEIASGAFRSPVLGNFLTGRDPRSLLSFHVGQQVIHQLDTAKSAADLRMEKGAEQGLVVINTVKLLGPDLIDLGTGGDASTRGFRERKEEI